tara:strand:- start:1180 stop:1290 length:111 start_codon:yes stop_codon:yes gene_type:complete
MAESERKGKEKNEQGHEEGEINCEMGTYRLTAHETR